MSESPKHLVRLRYAHLVASTGMEITQTIVVGLMTEDDAKDFVKGLHNGYWYQNNKLWIPPHRILEVEIDLP